MSLVTLNVKLFGHLQLTEGTHPLPSPLRPRAQRLLAYLLLRRYTSLTRETIAFTLWPNIPEKESLAMLRRALNDLRTALPQPADNWVLVDRNTLRWNLDTLHWLDVDAFERGVRESTIVSLQNAVQLYTNDLLLDFSDDWVLLERERLRQLQLTALNQLAGHHRTLGNSDAAIALTRQSLLLDPLSEVVYRDLIALQYAAGDRAAALATYERLRGLLRAELQVEPMAETQALMQAITQGAPLPLSHSALAQSDLTASPQPTQTKPIGRETEIAGLRELWATTTAGRGRVVIVGGAAGVGKSALAFSLVEHITRRKGIALVGHCYEFEEALPYQAIIEMLRSAASLLRQSDLLPVYRATLARLAPDLVGDSSEALQQSSTLSVDLRTQLFEALLQAFLSLARTQPVLMLFEDVHWAAESTLDWLTYIAPRLTEGRLLVAITYRTEEVGSEHALTRLGRRFARQEAVTTIVLNPLSREANRELVTHLSGLEASQAARVADRLFKETAGNPFFLHEIIRSLIESGQLLVNEGQWHGPLVAAAPGIEVTLPDSVREAINARVERLTEMSNAFIRSAAVAGRVFHYDVVQRSGGWSEELALTALEDVLARGFVYEGESKGSFVFTHHLMQEAIYADLTAPRRAYLHRRLAEAVQALRPDDYESLAYHFSHAGDSDRARIYYAQAADRARELVAMTEAVANYRLALIHWPEADRAGRAEILYKLGYCQWVIFDTQGALESFTTALALYEVLGDRVKSGEMERQIGRMYWELGDRPAALPHFHQALAILEQGPETVELARAYSSMSQIHMLAAEYNETAVWGETAMALAERLGAEDVIVHALNNLGIAYVYIREKDVEQGFAMLRESLRRALALGLPHDACRAYLNLGEYLLGQCRYVEAQTIYEELYTFATRVYARGFTGEAIRHLVHLDWLFGRWRAALLRQPQMVEDAWGTWQIWATTSLSQMDNDLGRAEAARQELENILERAQIWGELQTLGPLLEQLARAYAALELETKTKETIQQLLDLIDSNPYLDFGCTAFLLFACQWYATQPDMLEAARACLPRLERAHQQFGTLETLAARAEGLGSIARAEQRLAEAADQFRKAADHWERLARPYDRARALGNLGSALADVGSVDLARSAYSQALTIFDSFANELDDPELKASFLASPLVRANREAYLKLKQDNPKP